MPKCGPTPLVSDRASRRALTAKLLALMEGSDDPLAGFLLAHEAGRYAKPRLRLPQAPLEQNQPLTPATRFRLASAHWLQIETERDGRGALIVSGRRWILSAELVPVLKRLTSDESVPLPQLCAGLSQQSLAMLLQVLEALAGLGIVFKEFA